MKSERLSFVAAIAALCLAGPAYGADLFHSEQLTPRGEYTSGIEGPATSRSGSLYVVNFRRSGTIGKVPPGKTSSRLFAILPQGSIGNGIRFGVDGRMYVADYNDHNVFVFGRGKARPKVYFHSPLFNQPNDLAMAHDGTIYASDPDFRAQSGRIWKIRRSADGVVSGSPMQSDRAMGETNGIDLSPDESTLYVSESDTRQIWAYQIVGDELKFPRLVISFAQYELDGLRIDVAGRLFVARPGNGSVALVAADGTLVREITLLGRDPTNLTFGGPDGKTIFVTQKDGGFIETFKVDISGREPCLQRRQACWRKLGLLEYPARARGRRN